MGACIDVGTGISRRWRSGRAHEESEVLAAGGIGVSAMVSSRLELKEVMQAATEAARELTGAAFGAFFFQMWGE